MRRPTTWARTSCGCAARACAVKVDDSPHHMHHKFALFDRQTLATGSYNWTRGAAEKNQENLVLLQDSRLIAKFSREFEKIWKISATAAPSLSPLPALQVGNRMDPQGPVPPVPTTDSCCKWPARAIPQRWACCWTAFVRI